METNDSEPIIALFLGRFMGRTAWWSRSGGRCFGLLLLVLMVCTLWLTIEGNWRSNLLIPTRYTGDYHYILAMIKLAQEGDLGLFINITTKSLATSCTGQLNQELPAGEMEDALESYGFSRILFNRKDYADRCEQLLAEFSKAGWPMELEQGIGSDWVFIRLSASPNPVLPTLAPHKISVTPQDCKRLIFPDSKRFSI